MERMDGINSMPWYSMGQHHDGIKIEVSDIAPRDAFKYTYDLWSNGLSADAFTISRIYKVTMRSKELGDGLWTHSLDSKARVVNISYTGKRWDGTEIPMPVRQIDNMFLPYPDYKPEIHRLIGGTWIKGKWVDHFDRRNLSYRLEIVEDGDVFFGVAMKALDTIADIINNLAPEEAPEKSRPLLEKLQKLHVCNSDELLEQMDYIHKVWGGLKKLPVEPPELAFDHYHAIPLIVEEGCGGPCTFCNLYERKITVRPKENVFGQVDAIVDFLGEELDHYQLVTLLDGDALAVPVPLLKEELAYIRERFYIEGEQFAHVFSKAKTVEHLTDEELVSLKESGIRNVNIGMETGCDKLLNIVKPGQTTMEVSSAVHRLTECGIGVSVNIIAGLGGEEFNTAHVEETVAFVKTLPPETKVFFSPLFVEADCRYYEQQKELGVLSPEELELQCQMFMHSMVCSEYMFVPV